MFDGFEPPYRPIFGAIHQSITTLRKGTNKMNTQNTNAVNPSVIRQYESACTFEVPTTELEPDYITVTNGFFSSYQEAADVGRAASEHSACLGFRIIPHDHPALIAMQVNQCLNVGGDK